MSFLCMMESDNAVTIDGTEGFNHNVDYLQPHIPREDTVVSDNVIVDGSESTEAAESNGCVSVFVKSDEGMMNGSSNGDMNDESITHVEHNDLTTTKEGGQSSDHSKQPISQKGQGKSKNEKFQSPKSVFTSSVTKNKYCNDAEETAKLTNGSIASNSRPRQPAKNRSFNDRKQQQTWKSDAASSEGLVEKTKLKPSKKDPVCNIEDESQSSSATEGESKHLRISTLPNYGFSFRCNERAEKRKEFYSKLEEKIHALEVEKNNMQAKTKETQEAEVKMLRKSLNFKATPMPSFYMEPQPPKVELKKIPPTKAKSPKLGRRKSLPQEPQGNSDPTYCSRPSLDEETSQSPSKGPSMHPKKPQRKSLPTLRSQNFSSLSTENECKTVPSKAKEEENNTNNITNEKSPFNSNKETIVFNPENEENIHISNTINEAQSSVPDAELSEMQLDNDNKPMVEEQSQSI